MLQVRDLETFYGPSQVLFGVSLEVAPGEMVAVLGRNGMGKTTLVRSITGLTPPRSGRVTFQGRELAGRPSYLAARAGIGLVPEGRQIFPTLSVRENLTATAYHGGHKQPPWTLDRVLELFPVLQRRLPAPGRNLSGGEQQMLAIGRALMTNPRLLVLDEATEGLAPLLRDEIWHCLERLKAGGQSFLVVDRSLDALLRVADRLLIMDKGRLVWSGGPADLREDQWVCKRYLGV